MRLAVATTVLALVTAIGYAVACWLFPFAACYRCDGSGKKRSPSGKAWRKCSRCKGSGARLRLGRKVVHWVTGVRKDAA